MSVSKIDGFDLFFPEGSGFDKTEINFYSGIADLAALYSPSKQNRLFITDETIAQLPCVKSFLETLKGSSTDFCIVLGAGEKYKTIESVLSVIKEALDHNFNRNCLFVGIGGGVICDMTGFAASMFKRGVDCEFVPTTLLADVDASVGGKTGCDFDSYKNMIGAFWPARKIHVWASFVQSLPEKEYMSGLAEAIKTALLFSPEMVEMFKANKNEILARDAKVLEKIIAECTKAKARIVHEDFKEKGDRAFLNYGHTFGHALESVAGLGDITHGEGVAWGMVRALELARNKGICSPEFAQECSSLIGDYGYKTKPAEGVSKEKLLEAMHKDKKNSSSVVKVILQSDCQKTHIIEVNDSEILEAL